MYINRVTLFFCVIAVVYTKQVQNNYETAKEELEKYIHNKQKEINPRYRLHYHVAPPVGWMNDPNGFSYIDGQFHLFYQFYPYDSVWGPMHWGHVVSTDLVTWRQLPTALLPEEEQCFSGSAVSDGNVMTLMYTGHKIIDVEPFYEESQYLAHSDDGVNFYKYEGNPVLPGAPNGSPDFRDPKVWRYGDYWYVIIGSKTEDQRGQVLLYKSPDMKSWEFLTVLGESDGYLGYMWECPDFFELDGKFVLLMSPQGIMAEGDRYKNTHQNGYIIGSFNYDTYEFIPEVEFQEIDYGHDFYAAQTTQANGRRYIMAWFSMWDVPHPEDVDGWAGAMTIAREIKLVGNRIIMRPVEEMQKLREYIALNDYVDTSRTIEFGKAVELFVRSDLAQKLELHLQGTDGGGEVWLRWDPDIKKVVVDRGSGDVRQVEWNPIKSHSWRIFLDSCSLELFCGEGEVVFSSRVYPLGGWKLTNESPQAVHIEAYSLRRSVPL